MSKYDEYPMPAIADLLEKLCPEGVPTTSVQGACLVVSSKGLKRSEILQSGTYPVIDQGEEYVSGYTDDSAYVIADVPVIVFGDHSRRIKWIDAPFAPGADGTKVLRPDTTLIQARYFYHALTSVDIPDLGYSRHWSKVKALTIPLPPTDVQEQIVAILDTLTDLDASLNRELELRNDQFTHALDSVFGNSTAPRSTLGQVGDFTKGKGVTKSQLQDEGLPAFHYGQVHTSYGHSATSAISHVDPELIKNPTLAHPGDLVLATTSEDDEAVGKAVAWLGDEDAVVGGDAHVYSHSLEPRFVSYFFASHDFQLQKGSKVYGTKVRRINDKGLSALTIPVPAPETQERIADTLDMFTEYTTNLRREIELLRQQLEYYRDQLLTFPAAE